MFAWLFLFPCFLLMVLLGYGWFQGMGMRTAFFTYARGRIRFNRKTRKVYVLRPEYCGGDKAFEWERLVALFRRAPEGHPMAQKINGALVLYHPPLQEDDPQGKGEDAIFVGPTLGEGEIGVDRAAALWEYIRRYMEEGPSVEHIPINASNDHKKIPRFLPSIYTTYCGLPNANQYKLEMHPGFGETLCHMISQITCSWAKFPEEWQSDSGLGEPEDRPVQTGAVMTALAYRAMGKLSKEDEIEFLTHWGTEEALAEVVVR